MKVKLPSPLSLTCPSCGLALSGSPTLVERAPELTCPGCATRNPAYFWLSPSLRQEIAAQLRSRIYYEAHRLNDAENTD